MLEFGAVARQGDKHAARLVQNIFMSYLGPFQVRVSAGGTTMNSLRRRSEINVFPVGTLLKVRRSCLIPPRSLGNDY